MITVDITPEMLRAAQLHTELGAYACANFVGAYEMIEKLFLKMHEAASEKAQG